MRMMSVYLRKEQSLQRICDNVSAVIDEYGLKVSEIKSKVVCINGVSGNKKWKIGGTDIGEHKRIQVPRSDSQKWSKWWV